MSNPTKSTLRRYFFLMAVLTLCYLVVELAFNANVIDVIGGNANKAKIDSVEHWGRLISGCALGLIAWSMLLHQPEVLELLKERVWGVVAVIVVTASLVIYFSHQWLPEHERQLLFFIVLSFTLTVFAIKKKLIWMRLISALFASGLAAISFAYFGEEALLNTFTNAEHSADKLQAAVLVRAVVVEVFNGDTQLKGIPTDSAMLQSPSGKTFMAVFPLFFWYLDNPALKLSGWIEHKTTQTDALNLEKRKIEATAFNKVFVPLCSGSQQLYNKFKSESYSVTPQIDSTKRFQQQFEESVDAEITRELVKRHYPPNNQTARAKAAPQVREEMLKQLTPAQLNALNINPQDITLQFQKKFAEGIGVQWNDRTPFGLQTAYGEFVSNPMIQIWMYKKLGFNNPENQPALICDSNPENNFALFQQQLFPQLLEKEQPAEQNKYKKLVDALEQLQLFSAPTSDFTSTGTLFTKGHDAAESIIAPALALFFSCLGALTHTFKFCRYTSKSLFFGSTLARPRGIKLPNLALQKWMWVLLIMIGGLFFWHTFSSSWLHFLIFTFAAVLWPSNSKEISPLEAPSVKSTIFLGISTTTMMLLAGFVFCVLWITSLNTAITETSEYHGVLNQFAQQLSRPAAFIFDWVVKAQTISYPVNDQLRQLLHFYS